MSGRWILGVDEAGYGPSMGPLVIAATAWWIPDALAMDSLYDVLAPEILSTPSFPHSIALSVGDSKKIHHGKYGWSNLHYTALHLCRMANFRIESLPTILSSLCPYDFSRVNLVDWYSAVTCAESAFELSKNPYLQFAPKFDEAACLRWVESNHHRTRTKLQGLGIRMGGIQCRWIDEIEFNRQVQRSGNKSSVLSDCSLELARTLVQECIQTEASDPHFLNQSPSRIEMYFDKHGGRNRYQALLMSCFDDYWPKIEVESGPCSRYQGTWMERDLTAQFMVQGDSLFPSAASSILAKWVREVSMASLNHFWQSKSSSAISPTAGYYVDAVRFSKAISTIAESLRLPKESWWRVK